MRVTNMREKGGKLCTYGPGTLEPGWPMGCAEVLMIGVATVWDLGAAMLATAAAPRGMW